MGLCDPWAGTYLQNCKLEKIGVIVLKPIDVLMTTDKIKNQQLDHNLPQTCGGIK